MITSEDEETMAEAPREPAAKVTFFEVFREGRGRKMAKDRIVAEHAISPRRRSNEHNASLCHDQNRVLLSVQEQRATKEAPWQNNARCRCSLLARHGLRAHRLCLRMRARCCVASHTFAKRTCLFIEKITSWALTRIVHVYPAVNLEVNFMVTSCQFRMISCQ